MPVRQRENKWYWGSKGPFTSRTKAEKVAQAAYASGYVSKLFDFTKQVPPKSEGEVPDFTKPLDKPKIKLLGTNVPEEFREYLAGKKPPKGAKILIGARGKTFYDTRTLETQPKVSEISPKTQKIAEENDRLNDTLPDEDARTLSQSKIGKDMTAFLEDSVGKYEAGGHHNLTSELLHIIFKINLTPEHLSEEVSSDVEAFNEKLGWEYVNRFGKNWDSLKLIDLKEAKSGEKWDSTKHRSNTAHTKYSKEDIIELGKDLQRHARYLTQDLDETITVYRGQPTKRTKSWLGTGFSPGEVVNVSTHRGTAHQFADGYKWEYSLKQGYKDIEPELRTIQINRADILADQRGSGYREDELIIPTQVFKKAPQSVKTSKELDQEKEDARIAYKKKWGGMPKW